MSGAGFFSGLISDLISSVDGVTVGIGSGFTFGGFVLVLSTGSLNRDSRSSPSTVSWVISRSAI